MSADSLPATNVYTCERCRSPLRMALERKLRWASETGAVELVFAAPLCGDCFIAVKDLVNTAMRVALANRR